MKRIGLLSDTHGYLHPNIYTDLEDCDAIWHAGDIGSTDLAEALKAFRPLVAVHGNIDDWEVRMDYPLHQRFKCEDLDVWITHIGGYPGRYDAYVREAITKNPPGLFISGHSHILKVMFDKTLNLLHINPGAAGKSGIHQVITYVKFDVEGREVKNLKIMENSRR